MSPAGLPICPDLTNDMTAISKPHILFVCGRNQWRFMDADLVELIREGTEAHLAAMFGIGTGTRN